MQREPTTEDQSAQDSARVERLIGKSRRLPTALASAIVLGAIGSGLWELLFKPGAGWNGRIVATLVTFGSSRLRDLPYEIAALDPTPLPSLLLLLVGSVAVGLPLVDQLATVRYRRRLGRAVIDAARGGGGAAAKRSRVRVRLLILRSRDRRHSAIMIALVWALVLVATFLVNHAIFIHRTFYANLRVCSFILSSDEEALYISRFARMRTRSEYSAIARDLRAQARAHGITLHSGTLLPD